MRFVRPDQWDAHYSRGKSFRPLGDAERELLSTHLPARPGALALDVGCGRGELATHLASNGYVVDAVDFAPAVIASAVTDHPGEEVTFLCHDMERDPSDALPHAAYDLITLRLVYAVVHDRTRLMNHLRRLLRPGGTVCVITPLTNELPQPQRGIALSQEELTLLRTGWGTVEQYDADGGLAVVMLREPALSPAVFKDKGRPPLYALAGSGIVVTNEEGQVLLGWSTRGMWETPGGKPTAGESFQEAAVRELKEETSLTADVTSARLVAILMDSTHGIPRVTAAVRVTSFTCEPTLTEPDLFQRWEWHEVADLPALGAALFTPSAQVLEAVWPGLFCDLPPVHCDHITHGRPIEDATDLSGAPTCLAPQL